MDITHLITAGVGAVIGGGGVAGIVIAWLNRKPGLIKAEAEAEATANDQWRQLLAETRSELQTVRSESEKIRASYYGLLGAFVEFRNHVRTEVARVTVALDRKAYEDAAAQLEALGRHVAGVKLPTERA